MAIAALSVVSSGLIFTGGAAADGVLTPNSHDFGSETVGAATAPQVFELSVQCTAFDPMNSIVCINYESLSPAVVTTGPFAVAGNNCPENLVGMFAFPTGCMIEVVFAPTAAGPAVGTLSTGTEGPTAQLQGSGVAVVSSTSAGSGDTATASTPSPPAPPSNSFSFGRLKLDKHHGTATLTVAVPGAGTLDLAGKGVAVSRPATGPVAPGIFVQGTGDVSLKIVPAGKAKKKLERTGKATVEAAVTFTPTGGSADTQTKTIHLKKTLR